MSNATEHYKQASRGWMIVAGLLGLAVLIDVVREHDGKKTRKR